MNPRKVLIQNIVIVIIIPLLVVRNCLHIAAIVLMIRISISQQKIDRLLTVVLHLRPDRPLTTYDGKGRKEKFPSRAMQLCIGTGRQGVIDEDGLSLYASLR